MDEVMMKCGHTANAVKLPGNIPCCAICNCYEAADKKPSLEGREAKCSYCKDKAKSKWSLPFFRHNPTEEYDEYYCGCRGWE